MSKEVELSETEQSLPSKPIFHLASAKGWVNDPNGPFVYKDHVHLFYQHVTGTRWSWGLAWGHAVSKDLVHWEHLPLALEPTPGHHDQDGCFSGCATINTDGRPVLLYTGVVRREGPIFADMTGLDVSKVCVETQLAALAQDPDNDPLLTKWVKQPEPWIKHPPPGLVINCFRDPFIIERPSPCEDGDGPSEWVAMIGSGVLHPDGAPRGTALVYRSQDLLLGWEYDGQLCEAGPDGGPLWECPVLCRLSALPDELLEAQLHGRIVLLGEQHAATPEAAAADELEALQLEEQEEKEAIAGQNPLAFGYNDFMCIGQEAVMSPPATPSRSLSLSPSRSLSTSPRASLKFGQLEAALKAEENLSSIAEGADTVPAAAMLQLDAAEEAGQKPATARTATAGSLEPGQERPVVDHSGTDDMFSGRRHMLCVSAVACPSIYWLGNYSNRRFDMATARGPFALDLGDIFYAPNLMQDTKGRTVMWAWCQERPNPGGVHDYSGCMSVPRVLNLDPQGHLHQAPLPELKRLRSGTSWHAKEHVLQPGQPFELPNVSSTHLDMELFVRPRAADNAPAADGSRQLTGCKLGIRIKSWRPQYQCSSLLVYNFDTCVLEMMCDASESAGFGAAKPREEVCEAAAGTAAPGPSYDCLHPAFGQKIVASSRAAGEPCHLEPQHHVLDAAYSVPQPLVAASDASSSPSRPSAVGSTFSGSDSGYVSQSDASTAEAEGEGVADGVADSEAESALNRPQSVHHFRAAEIKACGLEPAAADDAPHLETEEGDVPRGTVKVVCNAPEGLVPYEPYLVTLPEIEQVVRTESGLLPEVVQSAAAAHVSALAAAAANTAAAVAAEAAADAAAVAATVQHIAADAVKVDDSNLLEDVHACSAGGSVCAGFPSRLLRGALRTEPGAEVHLRMLLDYNLMEVFAGTGEVMSTRIYRGAPHEQPGGSNPGSGIELIAEGGEIVLSDANAFEMSSMWR